eukprot:1307673-Prymnesium_polylepis.2
MEGTGPSCGGGGGEAGGGGGEDGGQSDSSMKTCLKCGVSFHTTYKGSSPRCWDCVQSKGGGKGGGNGGP